VKQKQKLLHKISIVIMAGGRGERFWPRSRVGRPKQFADLTGKGSMLYLTYNRALKLVPPERIFVVTGAEYREVTKECLPELLQENIIIEPEGRNTAPCIGLAAVTLEQRLPGAIMVVLPADHLIKDEDEFAGTIRLAAELTDETGGLVTVGIRPDRPETGYGYLRQMVRLFTGLIVLLKSLTRSGRGYILRMAGISGMRAFLCGRPLLSLRNSVITFPGYMQGCSRYAGILAQRNTRKYCSGFTPV